VVKEDEFYKRGIDMAERSVRIGATDSGMRFLERVYEIGKARPLAKEPDPHNQESES
jgi:hypothetical protein